MIKMRAKMPKFPKNSKARIRMQNYFSKLSFTNKLDLLSKCRFMEKDEFKDGTKALLGKKIVILGCGAQGLNQGLNLRESGLDVSFALRKEAIEQKRQSFIRASENNFNIGTFEELIPDAFLVINLTPDKEHSKVISQILPLMQKGAFIGYSHGLNIVEENMQIPSHIGVIMVAPKGPGNEVRLEYLKDFGVPALIAVHPENDIRSGHFSAFDIAKAWAFGLGSHKCGVLESSFVAEVKSDLMGEQTVLCGLLQAGVVALFKKLHDEKDAIKCMQYGWDKLCDALKIGGLSLMLDRFSASDRIFITNHANKLKELLLPLFQKHMDDILSGKFSEIMMQDWQNGDKNLLSWREKYSKIDFEIAPKDEICTSQNIQKNQNAASNTIIGSTILNANLVASGVAFVDDAINTDDAKNDVTKSDCEDDCDCYFFEHCQLQAIIIKAGVELAFEVMTKSGIDEKSAYYESLHELPLITALIAKNRLYNMNLTISDTAEYGNYLFANKAIEILEAFFKDIKRDQHCIKNTDLLEINESIYNHKIEQIGRFLRAKMRR
mgnify:CR=1 FL=1